jgi:hypothetical protein
MKKLVVLEVSDGVPSLDLPKLVVPDEGTFARLESFMHSQSGPMLLPESSKERLQLSQPCLLWLGQGRDVKVEETRSLLRDEKLSELIVLREQLGGLVLMHRRPCEVGQRFEQDSVEHPSFDSVANPAEMTGRTPHIGRASEDANDDLVRSGAVAVATDAHHGTSD